LSEKHDKKNFIFMKVTAEEAWRGAVADIYGSLTQKIAI
jgi:hypothetical protein